MPNQTHLNKMIQIHGRRLQIIEQHKATMGNDTPPHVLLEIENIEAELVKLCAQLNPSGDSGQIASTSVSPPAASAPKSEVFVSYA